MPCSWWRALEGPDQPARSRRSPVGLERLEDRYVLSALVNPRLTVSLFPGVLGPIGLHQPGHRIEHRAGEVSGEGDDTPVWIGMHRRLVSDTSLQVVVA